ncbi:putative organic hydroperoxide resistance transcriptional regulator [Corynebacterium sp. CMW7794]|uniref:MarR family winged helix-turn-helix transcriptional regulator n=1 Tax=Corynebacterium TaxID=1716 RepID=UPI0007954D6C|nr:MULTISPECIES: MarR family transcriptional regulator [Corynebacterium]KXI15302.1 putative organic hydroperoxide resistance transcriptional regulator [Corynebacterium sp. CMW7794]MBF9011542.1 MarR family transcriptional regulator [Corynebacterium phoceense]MCQ9331995.1 MarR family transcriptional regulator [Corynebacterium phoceense]MCQ9348816.1 MarR family transcriptional regulator [Corynebacterium phoceense]
MSRASLELDKQLCFALYRASHAVQRSYLEELTPLGLTYPQYVTMLALWGHEDPVTMKELSAEIALDSGTLTPLLRRMEKQGLLTRAIDPADERRRIVALTDKGRALREQAEGIPRRQMERFAASGLDIRMLKSELDRLSGSFTPDADAEDR